MQKYKLYIAGRSAKSEQTVEMIKLFLSSELKDKFDLKVIDIIDHPDLAEEDLILATPTLIRILPEPYKKIIGDFTDKKRLQIGLDLEK